jgi:hypothetical protein
VARELVLLLPVHLFGNVSFRNWQTASSQWGGGSLLNYVQKKLLQCFFIMQQTARRLKLHWNIPGYVLLPGPCEHYNETSDYTKQRKFINKMSDIQFIYFTPTNAHVKPHFCSFYCKMYPYTCFDPRIIIRVFFKKPLSLQLHILKGPIALMF